MEMAENSSISFTNNFENEKVDFGYAFRTSKGYWKIPKSVLYSVMIAIGLSVIINMLILIFLAVGTIRLQKDGMFLFFVKTANNNFKKLR